MKQSILILGTAGRLGYAAAEAFRSQGWSVSGLVRPGAAQRAPRGIRIVESTDRKVAVAAAQHQLRANPLVPDRVVGLHGAQRPPVQLAQRHADGGRAAEAADAMNHNRFDVAAPIDEVENLRGVLRRE